jgi:hypothetical protein
MFIQIVDNFLMNVYNLILYHMWLNILVTNGHAT